MAYSKEVLITCFKDALSLPADTEIETLTYQGHPCWDSVGHMRLIAGIETIFNVMLTTDDILDMSSFETARTILKQHGAFIEN